jgi:hypothetical protein
MNPGLKAWQARKRRALALTFVAYVFVMLVAFTSYAKIKGYP